MTIAVARCCGGRITSLSDGWVHVSPECGGFPWPAGKAAKEDDGWDRYGPRWPKPGAPTQLPDDFWDR